MARKAVFNNQHLAIYITELDIDALLNSGDIFAKLYYGKDYVTGLYVYVEVPPETATLLSDWLWRERKIFHNMLTKTGRVPKRVVIDPTKEE